MRVLLRADFDVPIANGRVISDFRIRKALPTIEFLRDRGAKTVILSHLGRSGETLRPVFEELAHRLGSGAVRWSAASPGSELLAATADMRDGDILMLENIRRRKEEAEGNEEFAREIAKAGDLFVNNAFADSHRTHASISVVPKFITAYAGLQMEEEVEALERARMPESPALAILGGAKFETKEPLIEKFLSTYDRVLLGGALMNDFLKAKGYEVGVSRISGRLPSTDILEHPRLTLPVDIIVEKDGLGRATTEDGARKDESIVDIGPKTVAEWSKAIQSSRFVLWNGPLGIYEKGFIASTEKLARTLASSGARAVIGGNDTVAIVQKTNFDPERVFLSTGGGAMLEFLVKGTLPGIEPLRIPSQ